MKTEKGPINLIIPLDIRKAFRKLCFNSDKTMTEVLAGYINTCLKAKKV